MWGLLWATATSTLNSAVCWALDVGPWKYMLFGNVRGTSKNITTFQVIFFGCPLRSRDTAGNTVEENSSFFTLIWMHCLQGHIDSKTLHQQNPSVLNWRCRLTPAYIHTHTYIHTLFNDYPGKPVPESKHWKQNAIMQTDLHNGWVRLGSSGCPSVWGLDLTAV